MSVSFESYLGMRVVQDNEMISFGRFVEALGFSNYNRLLSNFYVKLEDGVFLRMTKRGSDTMKKLNGNFRLRSGDVETIQWKNPLLAQYREERIYYHTETQKVSILHALNHIDLPQYCHTFFIMEFDNYEPWVKEEFLAKLQLMTEDNLRDLAKYALTFGRNSNVSEETKNVISTCFMDNAQRYAPPVFFDILTHERMIVG